MIKNNSSPLSYFRHISLDADIAALAHSADEQTLVTSTVVNRSASLNNLMSFHSSSTSVMAMAPGEYNRGSGGILYQGVNDCDTITDSTYHGEVNPAAMDLAMSNGYLSRLDSLDMNIGTFSNTIDIGEIHCNTTIVVIGLLGISIHFLYAFMRPSYFH